MAPTKTRSTGKRSYRKRRVYAKRKVALYRRPTVQRGFAMSPTQLVKLKYCEFFTIDPAGEMSAYVFRANDLVDPNYTGVGHQPMGFDQWATFYTRYLVISSLCKFTVFPAQNTVGTGNGGVLGVCCSDQPATTTESTQFIEDGKSAWRAFGALGANPVSVRRGWSLKKYCGVKDYRDQVHGDFGAQVTNNVADPWYFHCQYGCPGDTINALVQYFCVEITYLCYFTEPKDLSQS